MSCITPQQSSTSPPPITIASYPFDKANTDIILRTSDHVDFHIYSQILIAASPFFEGMFDVPQPPPNQQRLKCGRPIIDVSETSKALDPLLRICYPINKSKKRSLEEIELALAAAMKFEMELPTTVLTEELHTLAETFPLEVWAIACRLHLEHVAYSAGDAALFCRLDFTVLGDMEGITAANYFRFRQFNRLRGQVPPDFKFLSTSSLPKRSQSPFPAITNLSLADAPPPDVICRSADGVEFRGHNAVLSVASTALREKISSAMLPVPEKEPPNEFALSVVQFEEESIVLYAMLQLSYRCPTDVPLPSDLADLTVVLGTVEKYGLHSAQPTIWPVWQAMASASPLRAYCLAIRVGHTLCASEAARLVLKQVIDDIYVEELECTPSLAYHRLLNYYEKCRAIRTNELTKIGHSLRSEPPCVEVEDLSVKSNGRKKKKVFKGEKGWTCSTGPTSNPPWLLRYLRDLQTPLQSPPGSAMPGLFDLLREANRAGRSQDLDDDSRPWCEECQAVAEGILEVSKALQQLSDDLNKVELEI